MECKTQVMQVSLLVLMVLTILTTVYSFPINTTMTTQTADLQTTESMTSPLASDLNVDENSYTSSSVTESDSASSNESNVSEENSKKEAKLEEANIYCEMPEGRDPMKKPPKLSLDQEQIEEIDDAQEMLDTLQCNRSLLKRGSEFDISIVNLTTHQINKLLPFYRPFFHEPSAQNDSLQQQPARERRNSNIRICPALAQQTIPQLAFNSEGTISQIIQLNSMNVNQIFFEEECEFSTSPILPSVDCISSTRLVNAFVIDLATNTISTQYIEIQSCVSVLGPP